MDGKQQDEPAWQFKPGETISPRAAAPVATSVPAQASSEPVSQTTSAPADPAPQPTVAATAPQLAKPVTELEQPVAPEVQASAVPDQYPPNSPDDEYITWTASEYISHEKTTGWHVGMVAIAIVVAVIAWLVTRDVLTAIVIVVAGAVLSLYGARRPNELQYQLDSRGLSIGQKHFNFADFRAFSIIPEGSFASIALIPSKRFSPMTTLYFAPEDGDKILDILGMHLPHQERKADAVDSLMRKIRF